MKNPLFLVLEDKITFILSQSFLIILTTMYHFTIPKFFGHIYHQKIKPVFDYFRITPETDYTSYQIDHNVKSLTRTDYLFVFIKAHVVHCLVFLSSVILMFLAMLSYLTKPLLSLLLGIKLQHPDLIDIEKQICRSHNDRITRKTFSLSDVNGYNIEMKVLVSQPTLSCDQNDQNDQNNHYPILLLIHGIGGSAMGIMISTFRHFNETYEIHSLDLPGFGISSIESVHGSNSSFINQTPEQIQDFYVQCIGQYIKHLKTEKKETYLDITVLAHSFGAFLSIPLGLKEMAAKQFCPTRILLLNPAGIFPLLGEYGAYWSIFFRLDLPFSFIRMMRSWCMIYIFHGLNISKASIESLQTVYHIQHLGLQSKNVYRCC